MSAWTDNRPKSPHLQVWKWHWTMAASILHRATGVANYVGAILVAVWLVAAATGPEAYRVVEDLMFSLIGQVALFGFTVAVIYHFANGLRHLVWDGPSVGFDPKTASAVSVLNFAIGLFGAAGLWSLAYFT